MKNIEQVWRSLSSKEHKVELRDIISEITSIQKELLGLVGDSSKAVGDINNGVNALLRVTKKQESVLDNLRNKIEYATEGFAEVGINPPSELNKAITYYDKYKAINDRRAVIAKQLKKGVNMI